MASEGPSFIVVNNDAGTALLDAATDLVTYIQRRSPPEEAATLNATLDELKADSTQQTAFVRLAEHAQALLKAPPAEFESVLNLLWFVLAAAPDFDAAAHIAVSKLTSPLPAVVAQQVALQAVLASLFNILEAQSGEKPYVFAKITELAESSKTLAQFVPQLPQLAEWLRGWAASDDVKHEIVLRLAQGLRTQPQSGSGARSGALEVVEISKYSVALREFLVSVLKNDPSFAAAAQILVAEVLADGNSSLDRTLYKPEVLPLAVLRLEGVQNLRGQSGDHFEALEAIVEGDFAQFAKLSNPDVVENAAFVRQARVAALSRLASSTPSNELSYADISQAVQLPVTSEAIEPLIIDAVKSGLVQGRMSQLQQKFVVESATVVGPITDHHWDTIQSRLQTWQKSLKAVLEVSSKARNNYDLVKSLNKLEVN